MDSIDTFDPRPFARGAISFVAESVLRVAIPFDTRVDDDHLGYTQIVRLVEAIRVKWEQHLFRLMTPPANDCVLTYLDMSCFEPLRPGETYFVTLTATRVRADRARLRIVVGAKQPLDRALVDCVMTLKLLRE